jgi:lipopolysaccharide export system permease protein
VKIIDRHLSGEFLRVFVLAALVFLALFVAVEFFERLRMILKYDPKLGDVVLLFAARLPWMATQVIPMATLVGTSVALTLLSRTGEIAALRCGGVPLRRVALPFLVCGFGLSLVTAFIQEVAAPRGFAYAQRVKEIRIKKRPPQTLLRSEDLWLRAGRRILHVDRVAADASRLLGVSVAELREGRVARRLDAREARWEERGWVLLEAVTRTFQPDGSFAVETRDSLPYPLAGGPEDFRIAEVRPEEASWADLKRRLHRYRAQGIETRVLEVGLWAKTSMPFVNLVLPLLAFPFVARARGRDGTVVGVVWGVGLGVAYWLTLALGLSAGKAGALPPAIAAWAGHFVYLGVGAFLLWKAETWG